MTRASFAARLVVAVFALAGCGGGGDVPPPEPPAAQPAAGIPLKTKVVDVGPLRIDGIYRSMDGPYQRVLFDPSEVRWITRFRTEVLDAASEAPIGDEFFCHSQLQLNNEVRLLVNATGIDDVRFPEGFGMPLEQILSGIPPRWRGLSVLGMVLNNHEPDLERDVKVRVTVEYVPTSADPALVRLKKLYKVGLSVTLQEVEVVLEDGTTAKPEAYKGLDVHWMVPPGPQLLRQRVRELVPVDSTVHFGVVHLHNHGRWMKLTDLTTGTVLWQTDVIYEPERVQIAEIPIYSSAEGFPVYPDHEYEIEIYYENTSDVAVDAMANMDLYYHPVRGESLTYPSPPDSGHQHG